MASGYANAADLAHAERITALPADIAASVRETVSLLLSAAEAGLLPPHERRPVATLTLTVDGVAIAKHDVVLTPKLTGGR